MRLTPRAGILQAYRERNIEVTCILEQMGLKIMGERGLEIKESNKSLMREVRDKQEIKSDRKKKR